MAVAFALLVASAVSDCPHDSTGVESDKASVAAVENITARNMTFLLFLLK